MSENDSIKVKEIIELYKFDNRIKKFANKHHSNSSNVIFRNIQCKDDVLDKRERSINTIDRFENVPYKLYPEDIADIEKTVAEYEIAVKKVIQCYGHFDFDYSSKELQLLIDDVFHFHERVYKIMNINSMKDF